MGGRNEATGERKCRGWWVERRKKLILLEKRVCPFLLKGDARRRKTTPPHRSGSAGEGETSGGGGNSPPLLERRTQKYLRAAAEGGGEQGGEGSVAGRGEKKVLHHFALTRVSAITPMPGNKTLFPKLHRWIEAGKGWERGRGGGAIKGEKKNLLSNLS